VISYLDDILVFSKNEDDHRIGIRKLNIMGKETDDQDKSIFIERNVSGYCGVLFRYVICVNCKKKIICKVWAVTAISYTDYTIQVFHGSNLGFLLHQIVKRLYLQSWTGLPNW
jgi:hypothetical protein